MKVCYAHSPRPLRSPRVGPSSKPSSTGQRRGHRLARKIAVWQGGFQAPSAVLLMRLVDRPSLPVPGAWPKGLTYPQDRGGRPAVWPSPVGCGRRIAHLLTRDEVQRQGRGLGERYGPPTHP